MGRALRCFALLLLAMPPAFAGIPAKNLGFQAWDERGRLEGWFAGEQSHFGVSRDCEARREGRCVLRIEGRVGAPQGQFQPLGQNLGPGAAAGNHLVLSGWIRTAGVEGGWAGLWARTDVEGKSVALENMFRDGPRGTTEWKRFQVRVPVATNATLIAFGVLLTGRGTAWFDDLRLEIDATAKVGAVAKTQVVDPVRPPVSPRLMDDAALRLTDAQMPAVREHWRDEARRIVRPIRSLHSDDFADLQFLKPILAGKRVVQLGESSHGVAEFNWMKARLVRFLHQEMGFEVLAFESSLAACDIADARVGRDAPVDVMRACIFGVWHSTETLGLFEYLDGVRATARPLRLAGFDVQDSSSITQSEVVARLVRQVSRVDAALGERIRGYEGRLKVNLDATLAREMAVAYEEAIERVARDREALRKLESARPVEVDLALQWLRSRVRFIGQLSGSRAQATQIRDEGMAENLDFVLDTLHPGRKVIVWAHNFHVSKVRYEADGPAAMGSFVARRRGAEVYTIGIYMGRGVGTLNNRSRYEILAPRPDSLEAILASAGWRMGFVDATGANRPADSWTRLPLPARDWGNAPITVTPDATYDGLIYIDTATPPEYL